MDPRNSNSLPPVRPPQQSAGRGYVNRAPSRDPQSRQQQAAADLIRGQLDAIYDGRPPSQPAAPLNQQGATASQPVSQPTATNATPAESSQPAASPAVAAPPTAAADRTTFATQRSQPAINAADWQKYHSAWQDYYRKYYEQYYTQQVASAKHSIEASAAKSVPATPAEPIASSHSEPSESARNKAVEELREKLLKKVEDSAHKARKSRHFMPIAATVAVLLIFGFLQYNQILIANVKAYVTPGSIDPANIIVEPGDTTEVGPESRLIIPKINVDTPVFYDIPTDEASQNKAMANGVAHFGIPGAKSHPGQVGNTVLSGHSSNDVFAAGDYKYIFMQLDKLKAGDVIYANYKGTRYTYKVTKTKEVAPTNVGALVYDTDQPEMTLITCTPLGTDLRRLLVTAEQVYPTTSKPAPKSDKKDSNEPAAIPGESSPGILSRLFGGGN